MAYKIVWTRRASKSVQNVIDYLDFKWNEKVANEFIDILNTHVLLLQSGIIDGRATKFGNVKSVLVTRQNRLYFRKKSKTIQMLLLFDTRQNPSKNPFE